jgi:hypothetical protein
MSDEYTHRMTRAENMAELHNAKIGAAVADEEAVKRLRRSVVEWNAWRMPTLLIHPDLSAAKLRGSDLHDAMLIFADLGHANLSGAHLNHAHLSGANLRGANLSGADFTDAYLYQTIFGNVDLTGVIGLETCTHHGPSIIDHQTLQTPSMRRLNCETSCCSFFRRIRSKAIGWKTKCKAFAEERDRKELVLFPGPPGGRGAYHESVAAFSDDTAHVSYQDAAAGAIGPGVSVAASPIGSPVLAQSFRGGPVGR